MLKGQSLYRSPSHKYPKPSHKYNLRSSKTKSIDMSDTEEDPPGNVPPTHKSSNAADETLDLPVMRQNMAQEARKHQQNLQDLREEENAMINRLRDLQKEVVASQKEQRDLQEWREQKDGVKMAKNPKPNLVDLTLSDSEDEEPEDKNTEDEPPDPQIQLFAKAIMDNQTHGNRAIKKAGPCDGSDPSKTLRWLRQLDEIKFPLETAQATAEGPMAAFIKRRGEKIIWEKLRPKIAERFINSAFPQGQRDALEELTQRPGESLISFNHEFTQLLNEAYDTFPENQEPLIRTYLSALHDRRMAESISRNKPKDLKAAVTMARERESTKNTLRPRRGKVAWTTEEVPSESATMMRGMETLVETVSALQGQVAHMQQKPDSRPMPAHKTPAGSTCYRCGKPGHFSRECRTKPNPPKEQQSLNPGMKCDRCRQTSHVTVNCRSGPPKRPCYCGGLHWVYDCPKRTSTTKPQPQEN